MITSNDLLECGFRKCDGSSDVYFYADDPDNRPKFWELWMYVYLYSDYAKVTYTDCTKYPAKEISAIVYDIEEIKNIISNHDLCIDKYKEVYDHFNGRISILDLVKQ